MIRFLRQQATRWLFVMGFSEFVLLMLAVALAMRVRYFADAAAYATPEKVIDVGGAYAWRVGGEAHAWTPNTAARRSTTSMPAAYLLRSKALI